MTVNMATIGFTKTNASGFFERIRSSGIKKVVDVRLHNTSQLAGFAKADDLAYFLKEICGVQYVHQPLLAPTDDILKAYKKDKGDWGVYEGKFLGLMADRKIENRLKPEMFDETCLLCSEPTPHQCHRRLVCEYLNTKWGGSLNVKHL
ncbi:DUF488 domain-containing protein [Asticcacaulis taihuensis]|uniref:DUF488 domain-containing protein n=1 Tax=Asticcacaulis taihuensis TaxID=260084 RepID=UPI003F7C4D35